MIVRPVTTASWHRIFTMRGSILPVIKWRLLGVTALATLIVFIDRRWWHPGHMPTAVPLSLMGLTLAIFLGFRNSVAYERWWEARKLWGQLVIVLRNLARQTLSFPATLDDTQRRAQVHRLIAFAHALRHRLRGGSLHTDMATWLNADEAQSVANANNPPNRLLGLIGKHYAAMHRDASLDAILLAQLDEQVSQVSGVLGGCERIHGTPIPFAYLLLLHRTVYIYCVLLPFCLVGTIGWLTPVMVAVLAYTFFGLEALGDQIEDPFDRQPNGLALDSLCRSIEISLSELLGDDALPAPMQPQDGVLF